MEAVLNHYLEKVLPWRLQALSIFGYALSFVEKYPDGGTYECSVDGKLKFQGKSTAITNPSIEMGIVHSRVLLEFLGIRSTKEGTLGKARAQADDITIESFRLPKVTPEQALSPCNGDKTKAEMSIVDTITAANKIIAHSTQRIEMSNDAIDNFLMCRQAIPVLFNLYFYTPLGISMPDIELSHSPAPS
jgi:hypothetical protein